MVIRKTDDNNRRKNIITVTDNGRNVIPQRSRTRKRNGKLMFRHSQKQRNLSLRKC